MVSVTCRKLKDIVADLREARREYRTFLKEQREYYAILGEEREEAGREGEGMWCLILELEEELRDARLELADLG